jgi:hypothetical protein
MDENTFFDIHMHVFNLSHPNISAFIKRFNPNTYMSFGILAAPVVGFLSLIAHVPPFKQLIGGWVDKKFGKIKNLLAVMEDDTDGVFLMLENCLREEGLLDNNGLHIDGRTYSRVVLTPLMMDFGVKGKMDRTIHYKEPCRKLIRRQVYDVFSAIKYYFEFQYEKDPEKNKKRYPHIQPGDRRIFEIYPFIPMNPRNYISKEEMTGILDKYFVEYQGQWEALEKNLGKFPGDVDRLSSNFAAGVKLYPPLDFDPWPEEEKYRTDSGKQKAREESMKVKALYEYCQRKGIPITVHGSESGFVGVDKWKLNEYTRIDKWDKVLSEYPRLKVNLAHFPVNEWNLHFFPKRKRLNQVIELLKKHENLWVDFSCRATSLKYYRELRKLYDGSTPDFQDRLLKRVMFGSDFSINLFDIDSYNAYVALFDKDEAFKSAEKHRFCCLNPQEFLFHS